MSLFRRAARSAARSAKPLALAAVAALGLPLALAGPAGAAGPAPRAFAGCSGQERLPRPQDDRFYVQCAGPLATVVACPADLVFLPALAACGAPTGPARATVTATGGPARLNGLLFGVKDLSATVRKADGEPGLDGVTVTFTTVGGRTLCTAVTDQFGAARCSSPTGLNLPLDELLRGYRAQYAGQGAVYTPSAGTGAVRLL
ncbi:hypothetical protein ACN20G_22620 [Streptomyces sp. BI20]|uniref:hypothetical protein n=1 Tax=Streptomyces sp. BI20 TaxID=3403460 RepID=UPI003C72E910